MIRQFLIGLACILSSSQIANACTLAPNYFPYEFGADNIRVENFAKSANQILIGKIQIIDQSGEINVVPKASIPVHLSTNAKAVPIKFNEIKAAYYFSGFDENAFKSKGELVNHVKLLSGIEQSGSNYFGSGGRLAGIFHDVDCERKILIFDKQEYLVFLDDTNFAMAVFAIDNKTFPDLKGLVDSISQTIDTNAQ